MIFAAHCSEVDVVSMGERAIATLSKEQDSKNKPLKLNRYNSIELAIK
ncbi:hypothetical protein H6F93_13480 [Leptolyngbya sp. FACHB-671]|nr:hypothetical protein [Leptolyngbya sp. FACHB-671]